MEQNELTTYLKMKGLFVDSETIRELSNIVQDKALRGHNVIRNFACVQGGNHSDDVAVVWALSLRIQAKEGFDWGWSTDLDYYHFNIAFSATPKGKELMSKFDDYCDAQLKFLQLRVIDGGRNIIVE